MKLKFLDSFIVREIDKIKAIILVRDSHGDLHEYPDQYPDAEINDIGFIGSKVIGGYPVEFLSFAKEVKYCPMCSGLGYFPDNERLCNLCKGNIVVKPEQYYGFYL